MTIEIGGKKYVRLEPGRTYTETREKLDLLMEDSNFRSNIYSINDGCLTPFVKPDCCLNGEMLEYLICSISREKLFILEDWDVFNGSD